MTFVLAKSTNRKKNVKLWFQVISALYKNITEFKTNLLITQVGLLSNAVFAILNRCGPKLLNYKFNLLYLRLKDYCTYVLDKKSFDIMGMGKKLQATAISFGWEEVQKLKLFQRPKRPITSLFCRRIFVL